MEDGLRLSLLDSLEERGCEPIDGSEGLTFFWLAWHQLGSKRTRGMAGPNPIQYSEIECWLDANGAEGVMRPWVHSVLSILDSFYLNWVTKKLNPNNAE